MKRLSKFVLLGIVCLTQTGCLGALTQLISLPFQLVGKVLDFGGKVVENVPMPPPGVF